MISTIFNCRPHNSFTVEDVLNIENIETNYEKLDMGIESHSLLKDDATTKSYAENNTNLHCTEIEIEIETEIDRMFR